MSYRQECYKTVNDRKLSSLNERKGNCFVCRGGGVSQASDWWEPSTLGLKRAQKFHRSP